MSSDEIRDTYRRFFEQRDHLALPGFSLIPAELDPTALFTVAGMHPLKPYFAGVERPPHPRITTCQPSFRTADIENIGMTTRHLTFFEMLGNFSFGDYFKQEAIRYAWDLSREGFGLPADRIWVTVFGGDEQLGLGPDQEAVEIWESVGVPRERIIECPRSENFWQAGPIGPCGPCSELYLDLGVERGQADDLPGGENDRFIEYWNLVFTEYDQNPENTLSPLPAKNIDTGLGLNRMAAILQDKETVFETDQFAPLIALGEELSRRHYGESFEVERALRILADHSRAMTFLIADGVVPSNEERGYVLRRVIRRAILQGRQTLQLEPGFLLRYQQVVTELMGSEYGRLYEHRATVAKWLAAEEESFGHTLTAGSRLLDELIERAKAQGDEGISAEDAFRLHDTHGFPFDLTLEIVAEHGLGVDEQGFESLMDEARRVSRGGESELGTGYGITTVRERAGALAGRTGTLTEFKGYDETTVETTVAALDPVPAGDDGRLLVKLEESPFYATGGGQVADGGYIEDAGDGDGGLRARVVNVLRLGSDQVLEVVPERGKLRDGLAVRAAIDWTARHATECNHTATHLLHAALRARLGTHVHQAGSYVGPDKLRFDFTHDASRSAEELRDVEDQINAWIVSAYPVSWRTTTLDAAKALGAMALFSEKYGEIVRMVQIGDGSFSRELCGGTHVSNTAEIGLFKLVSETSSAANVRRIEARTGPAAGALLRQHDRGLIEVSQALRVTPEQAAAQATSLREQVRELERRGPSSGAAEVDIDKLLSGAIDLSGAKVLVAKVAETPGLKLLDLADQLKAKLGEAAVVLAASADGKVELVASVAPELVKRGVKAREIVRQAAAKVGGGGGGRDTAARAGGRETEKLGEAIDLARKLIENVLVR